MGWHAKFSATLDHSIALAVPDRFELAFSEGGQHRVCEVVWRRAKMLGVKFIF
jgi:hypothetical protein